MALPTFGDGDDDVDAADASSSHGRTLIPWISDPPTCDCGALMFATETYDPRQAMTVRAWECRECDAPDRYRDDFGVDEPDQPQRGATLLQQVFR